MNVAPTCSGSMLKLVKGRPMRTCAIGLLCICLYLLGPSFTSTAGFFVGPHPVFADDARNDDQKDEKDDDGEGDRSEDQDEDHDDDRSGDRDSDRDDDGDDDRDDAGSDDHDDDRDDDGDDDRDDAGSDDHDDDRDEDGDHGAAPEPGGDHVDGAVALSSDNAPGLVQDDSGEGRNASPDDGSDSRDRIGILGGLSPISEQEEASLIGNWED